MIDEFTAGRAEGSGEGGVTRSFLWWKLRCLGGGGAPHLIVHHAKAPVTGGARRFLMPVLNSLFCSLGVTRICHFHNMR